jgi:hypothetical protein
MKYRITLFSMLFLMGLLACEKSITITSPNLPAKLVVDAQIESAAPPIVVLSTSLNYFESIDTSDLSKSFVRNAKVTLSDGSKTSTLKQFEQLLPGGFRYVYYSNDPANPAGAIIGTFGKSYLLSIEFNGQIYKSTTTIPLFTKKIDSTFYKIVPNRPVTDSFRIISAKITDPPGLGNYIRYFTKVNSQQFLPGNTSVFDDNVIDGKTYIVDIPRGVDKNFPLERENYGSFKKGDTVLIKYSNIDKATYDFWRTWEYTYQSVGNPFSSPGVVIGNVSNGALGAFCGYANSFNQIIITK